MRICKLKNCKKANVFSNSYEVVGPYNLNYMEENELDA